MADSLRHLTPPGELRAPVGEPVQLEFPELGESGTELAVDLWREGLYVAAARPKPPGTQVEFALRLGKRSNRITGHGEVAWIRSRDESAERPAGMEIRFIDLGRTARAAIKRWIGKHGEKVVAEVPQDEATAVDEELQAGVAALRAIFGEQGGRPSARSTEAELARAKAALLEARRRSEALIAELSGRLDETQTRLDETQNRLDETQNRLDQLSASSADQARLLEAASIARNAAESRAVELEKEGTGLASALETARQELAALQGSLAAASDTQEAQAGRIGELESALATAEASGRSAADDLLRLTESRDALKAERRTLMSLHHAVEGKLGAANARADRLQRQAAETQATLQGRLESLQGSTDVAEKARADLVGRLEEAAAQRVHVEEQLDALRTEATRLAGELESKSASQETREKRIEELESSLAAAQSAARGAADRRREMAAAQDVLERQRTALESRRDQLQGELDASLEEGHRLRQAASQTEAALRARLEVVETGLGAAEKARDELTGRLEESIAARATTEQQTAELTVERQRLGSLLETARAEIKRLEKTLGETTSRESEQARRVGELQRSLAVAESASAEAAQQLAGITRDHDALEAERAALTLARSELEGELTSVQEALSRSRQERLGAELALEQGLAGLQEELAGAREDGQYLTRRLEEMRDAREVDNQRMLDAVASRGGLETALEDARAETAGLEEALRAARETRAEQDTRLQVVEDSLAAAEAMSLEAAERLEETIRGRDSLLEEHTSLKAAHGRLQRELVGLQEEKDAVLQRTQEAETALRQEVERLQGELSTTIEARADLGRRLEEESRARAAAEQEARDTATRAEQQESTHEGARARAASLEEALAVSRHDLDTRNRHVAELEEELAAVRSESDRHRQQAEATKNSLLESLETLQAESGVAAEAHNDLARRIEQEARSRADLERERTALRSALEKQRHELHEARQEREELQQQAEQTEVALRRDVEALALERDATQEALNAARKHDNDRARRIEKLESALAAAEAASAESRGRLTETTRSHETLSEERSRLQNARLDLERQLKASRAETASLQRRAEEKEAALRSGLEDLEGQLNAAAAAQADLTRRLAKATDDRDAAQAKNEKLDVDLGRLGSELQGARREMHRVASVPPQAAPAPAASRRRSRPKTAAWLTLLVVVGALAITWLLAAGKSDDAAPRPVPGRQQTRSAPAAGDSAPAAHLAAAEARPKILPRPREEAGPPARTTPPLEMEEAAAADRQRIIATLEAWARSWSEQRVDDYLALYSPQFRSTRGLSLEAWSALRRQRILEPAFIEVTLDQIEVEPLGPDRARASFAQSYSSDSFNDQVGKLLELHRDERGWRIVAEEAAP